MGLPETLKTKPITGEEFFKMGDIGRCELVRGEVIHMSPAGWRHGEIAHKIAQYVSIHADENKLGEVSAAETGFYVQRNPDTVRAPDAMFVSNERVAQIGDPVKFLDVAPDLAIEVLSPDDTWMQVETKVEEYFQAGVPLIWVVDPDHRRIAVYNSSGNCILLHEANLLSGEDVLPDFSLPVSQIFE